MAGSKFRGVVQTSNKNVLSKEDKELIAETKEARVTGDGSEEKEPMVSTHTVYTFARPAGERHSKLVKVDFNIDTLEAMVVGVVNTEHQASAKVHETSQYGLKTMYDRKASK